jgi:hypothetical protein
MTRLDSENPLYFQEISTKTGSGAHPAGPLQLALELLYKTLDSNPVYSMNPQIPKAIAPMRREIRSGSLFFAVFSAFLALSGSPVQALFTQSPVIAFQVPDDRIKIDGTPDTIWKAIAARSGFSTLSFQDYSKLVLLNSDKMRNDDPAKYVSPAPAGYVTMMAAFDTKALYFYFQVKTGTVAQSTGLCTPDKAWKADAPVVFLDPSPWSPDTAVYRSYFSTDASGLIFGTSPKSIQIAKPIYDQDARIPYFRNRASGDKFQIPASLPTGVTAKALRYSKDPTTVSVEMKIPFWGGANSAFQPGKSMFISWGFNMYPDSLWQDCDAFPLSYNWAKHALSYENADTKPPGWRAGDTIHYDPLRSWDGWGQFILSNTPVLDPRDCYFNDPASWNITEWRNSGCGTAVVTAHASKSPAASLRSAIGSPPRAARDVRGRSAEARTPLFIFPWDGEPQR